MNKWTLLALVATSFTAQAQQLTNGSFDTPWEECFPYIGQDGKHTKSIGTQPKGWNIANVYGMNTLGATVVAKDTLGLGTDTLAVKLANTPNSLLSSQIVPGYMGLGTTWNTSVMGKENDGGSFGGIEFTNRPDAVEFYYQRICPDSTANIPATFVAYLWKGQWQQAEVPIDIAVFGSPKKETMIDRDRNILDMPTDKGGEVTKSDDALLIASTIYHIEKTNKKLQKLSVPLEYHDSTAIPAKMNLVFAANDYFDATTVKAGNSLIVDSVKLVYYHELDSVAYGDKVYKFAAGQNVLNLTDVKYDASTALTYFKKGVGATVKSAYNAQSGVMTIEVMGDDFATNPASKSVYYIRFAADNGTQLVNAAFNEEWLNCYPYFGHDKAANKAIGTQPAGWNIANVWGMNSLGATQVGEQAEGMSEGTKAVKLTNTPNPFMASQIVPGYMGLGTPWNTSVLGKENDGGSFGGVQFTHRPDAVEFYYQRAASDSTANIPATVVAYLWKGEFQQAEVPVDIAIFGSPNKETMIDRDRNILGLATDKGGEVTKSDDAELIGSVIAHLTETPDTWTKQRVEIDYKNTEALPAKMNLVFAANDYFDATTVKAGNSLMIDSVKFVYYHELDSVAYGDKVYKFAAGQDVINLTGVKYDAETALTYFKKGVGATVKSAYNEKSGVMTVEVLGEDFDTNPASKSVYYIHFAADNDTQLVNASFDEEWLNCYPYFGHDKAANKAIGTQPAGWNIANVWGMNSLGATQVGEQAEGMSEGTKAVKLTNTPNPFMASQIVPGYMGLGTPWNTSVLGSENDGGSFGGVQFTHRPDAVEFYYQRAASESTANVPATVVAYLWKGEFQQAEVPVDIAIFGSPNKETMIDRDRNILGLATDKGGEVTKSDDAELIGSVIAHLTDTTDTWTKQVVEIDYKNTEALPAKMNLVFAANDYFDATTVKAGNSLMIDSVKFVYYHGIDSVQYKGNTYVPENGLIDLSAEKFDAAEALTIVKKGVGATVEMGTYDPATGLLPVTVRSEDFAVNPAGVSTYQLQFYVAPEGIEGITQDAANGLVDVYSVEGKLIRSRVAAASALNGLSSGVYIINGQKVMK